MESVATETPETSQKERLRYLESPTIIFSVIIVAVYLVEAAAAGNFLEPLKSLPVVLAVILVQCNPCLVSGLFPWGLVTSMFVHANIVHLTSNLLFLLIFGWVLEEQYTENKTRWVMTFLLTGIVGNLTFLASYIAFGPTAGELGVGASGAVYGILGAAAGLKGFILIALVAGIDIAAGGGLFAHIGGLFTGMFLRWFWITRHEIPLED